MASELNNILCIWLQRQFLFFAKKQYEWYNVVPVLQYYYFTTSQDYEDQTVNFPLVANNNNGRKNGTKMYTRQQLRDVALS